ncbi:MAG: hypothetical protein Q9208_002510 [Pyrenodesmia sp. 3 TL-2023]
MGPSMAAANTWTTQSSDPGLGDGYIEPLSDITQQQRVQYISSPADAQADYLHSMQIADYLHSMNMLRGVYSGSSETPQPQIPQPEGSLVYINAKQFPRIIKRRAARKLRQEVSDIHRPYKHESRHKHAMKRPRGPGGRFLTREELEGQGTSNQTKIEKVKQVNLKPAKAKAARKQQIIHAS